MISMEFSHGRAVMVLPLSLLLLLHSLSPTNAATQLVIGVCKQTINYINCVEALESDSRTPSASNLKDLAKIALGLALSNATESKSYIDGLLKKQRTAPVEKCSFWYEAVVGSFRSSLNELEEDALTANYDAKIAGDYAISCENELSTGQVRVRAISTRNNYVLLYSSIGFVITNQL
jgi:pectinesterase inhibitor-like protein